MANQDADPDRALLCAVVEGDRAAFDRLYRRYYSPLSAFATKLTRRADTAEEIVNESMLVVWRSAHKFNGHSKARTWIFGIAYKQALNAIRARRRSRSDENVDFDESTVQDVGNSGGVEAVITRDSVARALGALPPEQRAVVELTYFFGHSVREISEIVGCPAGTVKTRMLAARHKMHAVLKEDDR